ncbi:iron-sulfur cluster assembly accessory protein [Pannus brasiliensis CCIBt3594]|uniref:Iron-sulfur cluster assembly accessory protein n=1 Tax=Pannus brasiliensis CCIBt3594 TaxID=1427578 RepID=A0AAW9QVP2_9CHRO
MIELTPPAAREIRRWQNSHRRDGSYLRLGIRSGGCSGLYYTLELTDTSWESDRTHESQGIRVLVDSCDEPRVRDLKLDYAEDLMGGGFRFSNPDAVNPCSCGLSFSVG